METAVELVRDLWPIIVIMAGLILALILDHDKKEKKQK